MILLPTGIDVERALYRGNDRSNSKTEIQYYNRKTWTYNKYWKDVSFGEYKSAFNNKSKKNTIPDSYFLSNWPAEELDKKCILPIVAPAGLLKDPIRGEKIVFRMEFIMEQLLPLLRSRGLAKAKP